MSQVRADLALDVAARPIWFAALVAAAIYPYLLWACHLGARAVGEGRGLSAWLLAIVCLLLAISVPLVALALAILLSREERPSPAALLAVAVPPIFTLAGILGLLLGHPDWDMAMMLALWGAMTLRIATASRQGALPLAPQRGVNVRTAHGVAAVLAVVFLATHFSNHLLALLGAETHAAVMTVLRTVYRSPLIEPVLIATFGFRMSKLAMRRARSTSASTTVPCGSVTPISLPAMCRALMQVLPVCRTV